MQRLPWSKSSFVQIVSTKLRKSSNKSYDKEILNKTNLQLPYFYKTTFSSATLKPKNVFLVLRYKS